MSNYDVNDSTAKCPVPHGTAGGASSSKGTTNNDWWPNQISLEPLLHHNPKSNPLGEDFDYAEAFKRLDLKKLKADIAQVMKTSQPWWPADYGHYGPLFIRMAWHAAGTYRVSDGRGGGGEGLQRFAPLNSWPDNVNLDKARRLLWPVKKKYGQSISWADLMILAGNVALEDMGFPTFGFAGGRADVWEPDNTYWGNETEWLANKRYDASRDAETLENPLAAVQMGLIYVNPEGPDGNPDFKLAAADIRTTFARMAMNDEETVALIAGGHAFGKTHGAGDASQVGPEPEAVDDLAAVGLGWKNSQGKGHSEDTISSGLEVTWTPNPIRWDNDYLRLIYKYEWEPDTSPAGAKQWKPVGEVDEADLAPHAHIPGEKVAPRMLTTDLALRFGDEEYDRISRKFLEDFDYFTDVFARAWFKLTHRDMGPITRYLGVEVPNEVLLWQDPVPAQVPVDTKTAHDIASILWKHDNNPEIRISDKDLVLAAWASAFSYRNSDKRGGTNGARIRLEPQRSWEINKDIIPTIKRLEVIYKEQVRSLGVSFADFIVLAGTRAFEKILVGGRFVEPYVVTGRGDASQDQTDIESFNHLKLSADPFRNVASNPYLYNHMTELFVDKSALLGLTPPEAVAMLGFMRSISYSDNESRNWVSHNNRVWLAAQNYFVNLLSNDVKWEKSPDDSSIYLARDIYTNEVVYPATKLDMLLASHSVLRAIAEVYASDDSERSFSDNVRTAWAKVMNNGMF